jgi:S1-C subfamily serine protease
MSNSEPATAPAPRRWRRAVAPLAAAALVLAGGIALSRRGPKTPPITQADVDRTVTSAVDDAIATARNAPPPGTAVYDAIAPSLVVIKVSRDTPTKAFVETPGDTITGVIVNEEGDILTSLAAVDGTARLQVTFADDTTGSATVKERDEEHDIAVLESDTKPSVIVPAVLGGGARIGDLVFAVGHPAGLRSSLTAGVVSGVDRQVTITQGKSLSGLIQFDAPVNPGNAGGPLLDRGGQVIGIVTALPNPTGETYSTGIGFAVPIETAGGAAGGPPR